MNVTFGLWADGGAWPPHGGSGRGSLGEPVVGPAGFLELLETVLGRGGAHVAAVARTATWQAKLEVADDGGRFWSRSLEADAWATARLLLQWRDELVEAGWDARRDYREKRLADLADAEHAGPTLPAGPQDRLQNVERALQGDEPVSDAITQVRLVERRGDLPPAWRRVLAALEAAGVPITRVEPAPAADAGSSLGRVQRWLHHGDQATLDGDADGTLEIATASSALLGGELVAQWLHASAGSDDTVLLTPDASGRGLDRAMQRRALPRLGAGSRSSFRGSLQVLLLAFQIVWRPLDVRALMDLLVLEDGPLPARAANRLAGALEQAPGAGSPEWREAWQRLEARELERADTDDAARQARQRLEAWRAWVEPTVADPDEGMPAGAATAICDRVEAWAWASHHATSEALYAATARAASDVRSALRALDRTRYAKRLLDRVIDQALADGEPAPDVLAEAGSPHAATHPGAIWGAAGAVVWWDWRNEGERPPRTPWSEAERRELRAAGAEPDDEDRAARALSAAWERAVLQARARLVLLPVGLEAGGKEATHPLAHRLAPALKRLATRTTLEQALSGPHFRLGGADLPREATEQRPLPQATRRWPAPGALHAKLAGRSESATSLTRLFQCQLKWSLHDLARLRPARGRAIPDTHQLLGTLAHALSKELFDVGPPPEPEEAAFRARELLEPLIEQRAVPLLWPAHAVDLMDARLRLPRAMESLARLLRKNALEVVATELHERAQPVEGPPLQGAIDLLAADPTGARVVVDLKWTRSRTYRREELREGRAVQLAVYGVMTSNDRPRGGYFLLRDGEFLTPRNEGLTGTQVPVPYDLRQTWQHAVTTWRTWTSLAERGELHATGVDDEEQQPLEGLPLALRPHCDWCDFATICRLRGTA